MCIFIEKIVCCLLCWNIKLPCFNRLLFKVRLLFKCLLYKAVLVYLYFLDQFPKPANIFSCVYVLIKTCTLNLYQDKRCFLFHNEWTLFAYVNCLHKKLFHLWSIILHLKLSSQLWIWQRAKIKDNISSAWIKANSGSQFIAPNLKYIFLFGLFTISLCSCQEFHITITFGVSPSANSLLPWLCVRKVLAFSFL